MKNMALVPILLSDLFDLPTRHLVKRPIRNDLLPEDILLALEDTLPRRCRRKRCWRNSNCEDGDQDEIVPKKAADEFQVNVNVEDFKPDEISVKATEKFVTVEGKHEEKDEKNGYVLRHFVRRYQLPEGHDKEKIASTLSSDGILTISAPKLALPSPSTERSIPVEKVSEPGKLPDKIECHNDQKITLEDLDE